MPISPTEFDLTYKNLEIKYMKFQFTHQRSGKY